MKDKQEHFTDRCSTAQKVQPAQPKFVNCPMETRWKHGPGWEWAAFSLCLRAEEWEGAAVSGKEEWFCEAEPWSVELEESGFSP